MNTAGVGRLRFGAVSISAERKMTVVEGKRTWGCVGRQGVGIARSPIGREMA